MDTAAATIKRLVMIHLVILFIFSSYCLARRSQCEIPSVEIGQTTTLTCHFDESVWRLQQKIMILHYRFSDNESPDTLLFTSLFNGKMEFYTHPDYLHLNTNEGIQVQIPRVTKNHAGKYVCRGMQSGSFEECSFTPLDSENSSGGFNTKQNKDGFTESMYVIWVLVGLMLLLGIFSIAAIVFLVCRGRCSSIEIEKDSELGSIKRSISTSDNKGEIEKMIPTKS